VTVFSEATDVIFEDSDFSQVATYTASGGEPRQIRVLIENAYSDPQGVGIAGVGISAPMATCRTSDVPAVGRGDTLETEMNGRATVFCVTEAMPDGTGVTLLRLSEV